MKRILSTILAVTFLVLSIGAALSVSAADWTNREVGGPLIQSAGITSEYGGEVLASSGSAVYVKAPVGKTDFKVAFKVLFSDKNLMEGESAEYTSHFPSIWLESKEDIDALFGAQIDTCGTPVIDKHFRILKKHLQAVKDPSDANTINKDIVDFGTQPIPGTEDSEWITMVNMNDTGAVQMFLEVTAGSEGEGNYVMSLTAVDNAGTEKGRVYFDMIDDPYIDGTDRYLCFGLFQAAYFTIFDVEVMESDIEGAVGKRSEFVHNTITDDAGTVYAPLLETTVVSSMNTEGNMASWGSAATYSPVVGDKSFKVNFDLVWKSTSNNRDQVPNYSALGIYLSDTTEFPADLADTTCLPLTDWFEITDRHLEIKGISAGNTATNGFQDFGAIGTLGVDVVHNVTMELKDGALSLTMCDKTWTLNYAEIADGNKYLGFALQGPKGVPVMIQNFAVIESDLAESIAADLVDVERHVVPETPDEGEGDADQPSEGAGDADQPGEGEGDADQSGEGDAADDNASPDTGVVSMAIPALFTAIGAAAVCVKTRKN